MFVYAGRRAGSGIAVTVVMCCAVVCMIIDQCVMQDKAQCASVDCFAVSTAGSRVVVSLQTARAVYDQLGVCMCVCVWIVGNENERGIQGRR